MVEQEAVNFEVAGSSPVPGAIRPCGLFLLSELEFPVQVQSWGPIIKAEERHLGIQ